MSVLLPNALKSKNLHCDIVGISLRVCCRVTIRVNIRRALAVGATFDPSFAQVWQIAVITMGAVTAVYTALGASRCTAFVTANPTDWTAKGLAYVS